MVSSWFDGGIGIEHKYFLYLESINQSTTLNDSEKDPRAGDWWLSVNLEVKAPPEITAANQKSNVKKNKAALVEY